MALHGLADITIGVPTVEETASFYTEFGLTPTAPGTFATADGGDQLHLVHRRYRQLVEFAVAADDGDDVARIRNNAQRAGLAVTEYDDGGISVDEPIVGIRARVKIRRRIAQEPFSSIVMNTPGSSVRPAERAPAIFDTSPALPRRLGHALYTTTDLSASMAFLTDVFGFKVSDTSAGVIAFLRCGEDHHNIGLINAPVPFFHHSSWQVNDLDEIGRGAQHLLAVDPSRNIWGLGRHFLGSNLFWYFRDPAGNFAEYFSDLDQIPLDAEWETRDWAPDKSLYAWGPPVPPAFVQPADVEEIAAAIAAQNR